MKKIITIILVIIIIAMCLGLCSCERQRIIDDQKARMFYTEDFHCIYNEDKTEVIIMELTDKGKEKEVLAIPDYIYNLPVTQIGYQLEMSYPNLYYSMSSDNLKKIYIGKNIKYSWGFGPPVNIVIGNCFSSIIDANLRDYREASYVYVSQINIDAEWNGLENFGIPLYLTNVDYYKNISGNDIYWSDYIDADTNLIIEPEKPTLAGYKFVDWYLESECINKWDGNYVIPENEVLKLYAKWEIEK